MPQEFQVLQCFSCRTFQVHQVKKSLKWPCKLCGEKQSVKKVHGRGTGAECRQHVQRLNMMRGELELVKDQYNTFKTDNVSSPEHEDEEQNPCVDGTKWGQYMEEAPADTDGTCGDGHGDGIIYTTDATAFTKARKERKRKMNEYQPTEKYAKWNQSSYNEDGNRIQDAIHNQYGCQTFGMNSPATRPQQSCRNQSKLYTVTQFDIHQDTRSSLNTSSHELVSAKSNIYRRNSRKCPNPPSTVTVESKWSVYSLDTEDEECSGNDKSEEEMTDPDDNRPFLRLNPEEQRWDKSSFSGRIKQSYNEISNVDLSSKWGQFISSGKENENNEEDMKENGSFCTFSDTDNGTKKLSSKWSELSESDRIFTKDGYSAVQKDNNSSDRNDIQVDRYLVSSKIVSSTGNNLSKIGSMFSVGDLNDEDFDL